jgi:hypothetical protein
MSGCMSGLCPIACPECVRNVRFMSGDVRPILDWIMCVRVRNVRFGVRSCPVVSDHVRPHLSDHVRPVRSCVRTCLYLVYNREPDSGTQPSVRMHTTCAPVAQASRSGAPVCHTLLLLPCVGSKQREIRRYHWSTMPCSCGSSRRAQRSLSINSLRLELRSWSPGYR